jgi:hypothetical protein
MRPRPAKADPMIPYDGALEPTFQTGRSEEK